MRLQGKELLLLICDGVEWKEYEQLKMGFELEQARVWTTAPLKYPAVESVDQGKPSEEIIIDLTFDVASRMHFDGLIIPDGALSTDILRRDKRVIELIFMFHQMQLPIFASGNAVELLYESRVLSEQIVVREGTPMQGFLDQAVGVLLDYPIAAGKTHSLYRSSI